MKFKVKFENCVLPDTKLFYDCDGYGFISDPCINELDFDLVIEGLTLLVADAKMLQVSGFFPFGTWIKSGYEVPGYSQGCLYVLDDLEPGFSYGISDEIWPVFVNVVTGWVCVGDPKAMHEAVEFATNCVAVVEQGELRSLWLKPETLPPL